MMKKERNDVEFILWRKRVDKTLLKDGVTPIPNWLVKHWQIKEVFDFSKGSIPVVIKWGKDEYKGLVSLVQYDNRELYRLEIKNPGHQWLINAYIYSYDSLVLKGLEEEPCEFIDIEFDPQKKVFFLKDYYVNK
jgi:hypothetical protein